MFTSRQRNAYRCRQRRQKLAPKADFCGERFDFGEIAERFVALGARKRVMRFAALRCAICEGARSRHADAQIAEDVDFGARRKRPSLDSVDENDLSLRLHALECAPNIAARLKTDD